MARPTQGRGKRVRHQGRVTVTEPANDSLWHRDGLRVEGLAGAAHAAVNRAQADVWQGRLQELVTASPEAAAALARLGASMAIEVEP